MDAQALVEGLYPNARIRELAAGANKVFRVHETETETSILKVYPVASRERRERHALEALAGIDGVPKILNNESSDESAWIKMTDGGAWNLANLPKNLDVIEAAGKVLRDVHSAQANITNLTVGIDADYVLASIVDAKHGFVEGRFHRVCVALSFSVERTVASSQRVVGF